MVTTSQAKRLHQPRPPHKVRALGLTSGGLDSILSALVLKEQGIEVAWVNFETPFFSSDRARRAASVTGIPLTVKNISSVYIKMLKNPRCGYGTNMNPCLDCHALMLEIAGSMMRENDFDFVFTGEVLGQRAMSQTRPSLRYVEKRSGIAGYILRPLSAKLLPATIPEVQGLVDRDRLLDISGRSRKRQMELAERFHIEDYPSPAGGCLLTDPAFSRRVKDLLDHHDPCEERDFEMLKYGRLFRLNETHKVVVGRTRKDNRHLSKLINPKKDTYLRMMDMPGPLVLIPSGGPKKVVHDAALLCAAHSRAKEGESVRVSVNGPRGLQILTVSVCPREEYQDYLV
ncbi:MAG: tRNA 4-thiouridine(8) synthase ThiI [Deltaproteobacteria bacterium]|nr:MAG: tRNA 4-thiouridine(8) synthase ThiI [Deltaproteobacteria bacterium]